MSEVRSAFAAVFPAWEPLNNAILRDAPTSDLASAAAADLTAVYAEKGVSSWALWLPSVTADFDGPDAVRDVRGMVRDTTTLVMTATLPNGLPTHPGVVQTSVHAANAVGDEPQPAGGLPAPDGISGLDGWALVLDEVAVAGAWSFRLGDDVGLYAVGTAAQWRRRGLATALMQHVLADARRGGARTASLQSTRSGERLYASLGFRPVGRYEEWACASS